MRNPDWQWDELLLACDLVVDNGWKELRENDLRVMDLSDLLQVLPLHPAAIRGERFRTTGSVSRKTTDLASAHPSYPGVPTRGGRLDKEVIAAFLARPAEMHAAAERLRVAAVEGTLLPVAPGGDADDESPDAPEGRLLARLHRVRERDPRLRRRKIQKVLDSGGDLSCEVCSFNFARTYGTLGDGYVEVHHVVPLHASGETVTSLDDLALLCSNCHRMCHRSAGAGEPWRTPATLRDLVQREGRPGTA
ncbi:HNH endonuclease [Streptomyces sp. NPDC006733]|uniref:HNH endonuclease n=1 Tax=Streptomyces sp. NPDC006733 TaxID=3155460 RepID=UPI0033C0F0C7